MPLSPAAAEKVRETRAQDANHPDGTDPTGDMAATAEEGKAANPAPKKDKTAHHIPPEYRNEKGTGFFPGGDAQYKSKLINAALDFEAANNGAKTSPAHKVLGPGGAFAHWEPHLDKAREHRNSRSAAKAKREAAKAEKASAKSTGTVTTPEGRVTSTGKVMTLIDARKVWKGKLVSFQHPEVGEVTGMVEKVEQDDDGLNAIVAFRYEPEGKEAEDRKARVSLDNLTEVTD